MTQLGDQLSQLSTNVKLFYIENFPNKF